MKIGTFCRHHISHLPACLPHLAAGFMFLILLSACGLRADPVVPSPFEAKVIQEDAEKIGLIVVPSRMAENEAGIEPVSNVQAQPDAPSGLVGVYTGTNIILTWDEVIGQGVRFYRVYRAEGGDYALAKEQMTPAYIDKSVEKNREYYYKITAIGKSEGQPSIEIKIVTETH